MDKLLDQAAFDAWMVAESEDEYFAKESGAYDDWDEKEGRFIPSKSWADED